MAPTVCIECGGTVIEYDAAAGNGFCVNCGTVIEENTIVNEVTFGETSTGAAMVQGSYVGQGATRARMGGPFGNRGSTESREQTIANASRKIQQVASAMRLSEVVSLAATRLYTLAVEHKFTKGRKSMNVVAVCLYVACRQKETRNYMLIDFSDLLQVNVFELGHTYLQLVQTLNLRLPLVDPSHYISRFAALLEFGDETHQVAMDAVRLVQRFDRDWMTRGRRPAGICGACLLLAARMNNFRRSVAEIVQVVKIADTTLKKRLEEFRRTPSGKLTLADFRSVWLEEEMDPPAYIKGREKEEREREEREGRGKAKKGKGKENGKGKGKKRKRKRGEEESEEEEEEHQTEPEGEGPGGAEMTGKKPLVDPALLNQGILAGAVEVQVEATLPSQPPPEPLFLPEVGEEPTKDLSNANIDPALLAQDSRPPPVKPTPRSPEESLDVLAALPEARSPSPLEETVDAVVTEEVADFLAHAQGATLASALEEADARRRAQFAGDEELLGLDEEELDSFLLTDDEVRIKERVWVELNKDYLEAIAAKGEQEEAAAEKKSRKRRKTTNKPRDASTPHGTTAAESVRNLIKKNPKYSKRINYDALKDLFTDDAARRMNIPSTPGKGEEEDMELYTFEDKSEAEEMVVVEEAGGGVGMALATAGEGRGVAAADVGEEDAEGEEDLEEGGSEKGEEYAEWEGYEQEV